MNGAISANIWSCGTLARVHFHSIMSVCVTIISFVQKEFSVQILVPLREFRNNLGLHLRAKY